MVLIGDLISKYLPSLLVFGHRREAHQSKVLTGHHKRELIT